MAVDRTRHRGLGPRPRLRQTRRAALLVEFASVALAASQAHGQALDAVLDRPRRIRAPQFESEPAIDGRLDEQAWRRAERTGPFLVPGKRVLAGEQTEAQIFWNGGALFLGIRCLDSSTLTLRAECATRDGGGIFNDDCIEIFLAPPGQVVYYHLAVNSKGVLYDSKGGEANWDSHAVVAAHVSKDSWAVEMRIPLADLGSVNGGDEWGLNICREAPHYENPRDRDLSTWAVLRGEGFHEPQSFGRLVFREPDRAYRRGVDAFDRALRRRAAAAVTAKLQSNVWSFDYEGIDVDAMKKRLRKHGWYRARGSWREDEVIFPKANRYNTLLMRTAFAEDRLREVERMRFYLKDTASDGLRAEWRRVDEALSRAYQAYASLYQAFVQKGKVADAKAFGHACNALETVTVAFEESLSESEEVVRAAARAKPAWPMPERLGRQPRSVPAFQPSGKMNRLVIAGYGVEAFPQVPGYEHPEGNEFEYAETRGIVKPSIHTTKELAFEYDRNWVAYCRERGYRYYACLPFGYHYWMYCPYWFLEKNKGDPDILFRSWDGLLPKPLGRFRWREEGGRLAVDSGGASVKRGEDVQLNHYHPRVREHVRDTVTQFVRFCREQPEIDFYLIAGETNNYLVTEKGIRLTGYGPAATAAFRAYLRNKYGRIETLNEAWRATYGAFDDIAQPRDPYTLGYDYRGKEVLTPLMAEFRAFRNHAHAEYLKLIYETIKEADPSRPVSSYYGCPFWRHANFRARLMETCDLLEFHGSSTKMSLSNIYANSLLRYHKSKGLSYLETHWSYQEQKSRFAEARAQRRALEKETYRSTVWGRTLHRRWTPHCFSVDEHYYFLHPRHDWTILRYSAPAQIVSKRNLEMVDWILTHSEIVPSRLLVIDPSASIRNYGCSPNVMDRVHDFLFPRNWLYELLPEEYLLNGKASLDSFEVIILPYAKYFPHELTTQLIEWVKSGGVLIPIGTSGLYNELGLRDGSLLAELLNTPWEAQSSPARQERVEAQLVSRDVGKGRVLYVPHILHLLDDLAAAQILATLDLAGRNVWSRDGKLEVLVRVDEEGDTYVSVLNPSPDDAVVDTVLVPTQLEASVDVTLPGGYPVPRTDAKTNGRTKTQMEMRLGPCEWALVYCGRTRR